MVHVSHNPSDFQECVIAQLEHLIEKIRGGSSGVSRVSVLADPVLISFTNINDPVEFYPVMRTITIEEIQHHAHNQ